MGVTGWGDRGGGPGWWADGQLVGRGAGSGLAGLARTGSGSSGLVGSDSGLAASGWAGLVRDGISSVPPGRGGRPGWRADAWLAGRGTGSPLAGLVRTGSGLGGISSVPAGQRRRAEGAGRRTASRAWDRFVIGWPGAVRLWVGLGWLVRMGSVRCQPGRGGGAGWRADGWAGWARAGSGLAG